MINTGLSGVLTQDESLKYSIKYDGVTYGPTDSAVALGALLFGLQPYGLEYHVKVNPTDFMEAMRVAGFELHDYANGENVLPDGTLLFPDTKLIIWLQAAKRLAPDDATGREVVQAIFANMGPYAPDLQFFELVVTAPPNVYAPDGPRMLTEEEGRWVLKRLAWMLEKNTHISDSNSQTSSEDKQ